MQRRPNLLRSERLPPEPRQRRSLEKRARLKDAALALFNAHGYERTSIEEIAKRGNLATGTFYQHYRSKRQLLLVLMEDLLTAMSQLNLQPSAGGNPRTLLRELLARAFTTDRRYLGAYRAWREAMLSDPHLARDWREIREWTTQRVVALLTLLQQWPGARKDIAIAPLAEVVDTLGWSLLEKPAFMSLEQVNARIDAATHLIYHAVFLDTPEQRSVH
jgi:AcrR family transcriptional regulator